jgi:L-rhamnose mutarotase
MLVNRIRPEYVAEYVDSHKHMHEGPFAEQLRILRDAGATECICYMHNDLAILIYECDDIEKSFKALATFPKRQEWETYTAPMFADAPKFDGSQQVRYLEKIFDLNSQLDDGQLRQF